MTKPGWTELNAYVDGELAPDAAAEVARAVAEDRALAAQVAVLARLKAASAAALAVDPAELPPICSPRSPGRMRSWRRAAAALALVVMLGGLAQDRGPDPVQAWLGQVGVRHLQWLEAGPHGGTGAALASAPGGPVPDLGLMRLSLVHVETWVQDGRPALFAGYVGVNGCRLGLWIGPAPAMLPADRLAHRHDGLQVRSWRIGGTGYAVVARGMDPQRLEAVARWLEAVLRDREAIRMAARAGEAAGAPCVA